MGIAVKDLIESLKKENQNLELDFGGLDFYRVKSRGTVVQIEFRQTVYKDHQ